MVTNVILAIGIIVVLGFLAGLAANKLKFPRVTGYIVIGILMSPSLLNIISGTTIEELGIITDIALGIIAFLIGNNLHLDSLRKLGKDIAWITPLESFGAWVIVTLFLLFLIPWVVPVAGATMTNTYFPMAFVVGAICCATAPAATIAVVNEYRARGSLTTTLLAVVVLDDAIAVIAFSIALGIAHPLVSGDGIVSFYEMIGLPLIHIFGAIALGVVFAFAMIYMAKLVKRRGFLLVIVFGLIMLCVGIANYLNMSLILANMVVGFVVANVAKTNDMFLAIEEIEDVIFAMFFVLAGLHFDLSVIKEAGILAVLILFSRGLGKYFGAKAGATLAGSPPIVRKCIGLGLLPQAGVALGLVLLGAREFATFGLIMLNGVLASVIINELIAPPLVKYAISKAGEITPET